jgi:hypothetical protein
LATWSSGTKEFNCGCSTRPASRKFGGGSVSEYGVNQAGATQPESRPAASRKDFDVETLDSLNLNQILPALVVGLPNESPEENPMYFLSDSANTSFFENSVMERD